MCHHREGIYFLEIGLNKEQYQFHNFGIRNGVPVLQDFGLKYKFGYTFSKNWYNVGYTFSKKLV